MTMPQNIARRHDYQALAEKLPYPGQSTYVGKSIYWGAGSDALEYKVIGVENVCRPIVLDIGSQETLNNE